MIPQTEGHKTVMVSPLNWGLGHATRCIPIVKEMARQGHNVIICGNGKSLEVMKRETDNNANTRFIEISGIDVKYGRCMTWQIIKSMPQWISQTIAEKRDTERTVKEEGVDIIISDNRPGCRSKKAKSIYITHQITIMMPKMLRWLQPTARWIHRQVIEKFDECWIPDREENGGLSGELSHWHKLPHNARYIGPISRFKGIAELKTDNYRQADIVVIASGPEPEKTKWENEIIKRLKHEGETGILVAEGKPSTEKKEREEDGIRFKPYMTTNELMTQMKHARRIISKAGYTTIMDLDEIGKTGELYPTPGQTEQEYLSKYYIGSTSNESLTPLNLSNDKT